MKKKIRVLIADDCKVTTQFLDKILSQEADIEIVGCAKDGITAVELTKTLKPDLVTMDIMMPFMNGVEATRIIMEECPTPIIIISAHSHKAQSNLAFNALQAGALTVIDKPGSDLKKGFEEIQRSIISAVRALAQVRVVRRRNVKKASSSPETTVLKTNPNIKIIALGSSTGGPQALNSILSALAPQFPVPIIIVQHITDGFLSGLVQWLQNHTPLILEIAQNQQKLLPGHVYFAPDQYHLKINNELSPMAVLEDSAPLDHFKPAINILFSSLAKSFPHQAIGGLLTGMGKDGAAGLLQMKEAGCLTFSQSQASSVVYGMPAAAIENKASDLAIDLELIPQFLTKLISKGSILKEE